MAIDSEGERRTASSVLYLVADLNIKNKDFCNI
jgi:hypothetical protein